MDVGAVVDRGSGCAVVVVRRLDVLIEEVDATLGLQRTGVVGQDPELLGELLVMQQARRSAVWRRYQGRRPAVRRAFWSPRSPIADIPLGQKERAVLLKVGNTQILVGVAPGQVNTLHVLTEPLDLTKPDAGPADNRPTFKSLMLRSLGK